MIVLKNKEIADQEFNEALAYLIRKPLPAAVSWALSDLVKRFQDILDRFFKLRKEIALRYGGEELPGGEGVRFSPEKPLSDDCKKELVELEAIENTIDFSPVRLPDKTPSGVDILYEPLIMARLNKIVNK